MRTSTGWITLPTLNWQLIVHRLSVTPAPASVIEGDSCIDRLPAFTPGVSLESMCAVIRAVKEDPFYG